MANYLTTDTDLTAVADAIRTKGGTSAQLAFPAGFVSAVEAIPTGGGGYSVDDIATGNIGPNVVISSTSLKLSAFRGCPGIVSVQADNVSEVRNNNTTFEKCANMQSFQMSNLRSIAGTGDFCANCTKLVNIYLPLLEDLGNGAFKSCTALKTVVLQNASGGYNAFFGCSGLETVDFGRPTYLTRVDTGCFVGCTKLTTLIIRSADTISGLANISVFQNTPFASGKAGGTLYVPSALISSYQSATNWSTILGYANNQILPIEGSIYETQYADGTPIT